MPNRILREAICTSDAIERLAPFEEVCYVRLIVQCDDFGRLDARTAILRAKLFPLKEGLTNARIEAAIDELVAAGLVVRYEVDGKPFVRVADWDRDQRVRCKRSKYPAPDDDPPTSDRGPPRDGGLNPDPNLDPNLDPNPNTNPDPNPGERPAGAGGFMDLVRCPDGGGAPPECAIALTLRDGSVCYISAALASELKREFPGADMLETVRTLADWLTNCKHPPNTVKAMTGLIRKFLGSARPAAAAVAGAGAGGYQQRKYAEGFFEAWERGDA